MSEKDIQSLVARRRRTNRGRRPHTIEDAPPVNETVLPGDQCGARNKETI